MQDLPELVSNVRFTPRRGGYDMGAVDLALDRLTEALRGGQDADALGRLCDAMLFPVTRWGLGYDKRDVDTFLERIVQAAGGAPSTPPIPTTYAAPDVVSEQTGWFGRRRGRR